MRAGTIAGVKHLAWILALVFLVGAPSTASAVGVGSRAPEIGLEDQRGNRVRIGRYRGKVLIVNVWASWCEPCRDELPAFQRLYARYFRQGLRVVGINVDRDEDAMRRFVDRHGVLFPNVHDAERAVAARWGTGTMPTSWVVDPRGVVRYVNDGYRPGDERRIERVVRELLPEAEGRGEQATEAAAAEPDDGADAREPDDSSATDDGAAGTGEDAVDPDPGSAGPADAPPEAEPGESGRAGGLCSASANRDAPAWPTVALVLGAVALSRRRRRARG